MVSVQQLWKREYSNARYERWPNNVDPVDMAAFRLREKLFHFFGPAFGRAFSAPFDRNIAAAAVPWYLAGGAPAPIAVYQPKGAASLAASYINLVNPGTYDAAPGVAPTLDASGWVLNGSTQYLLTGVVPATGYSALVRYSDATIVDGFLFGYYESASRRFSIELAPLDIVYENGGKLTKNIAAPTSGVLGFADATAYRNGTTESGSIPAWSGSATKGIYIGVRHRADISSADYFQAAKIQAVAIWNTNTNHATWMPAVMAACALI